MKRLHSIKYIGMKKALPDPKNLTGYGRGIKTEPLKIKGSTCGKQDLNPVFVLNPVNCVQSGKFY